MQGSQCAYDEFHSGAIGRVVLPAVTYDLPDTIADTIGLGEAPMPMEPDLDYRSFEPTVSTVKGCDTCEDLQVGFRELQ